MSLNYQDLTLALQLYTVVLCVIGLFGNVNLIIATCRHKSLRTKMGESLGILCEKYFYEFFLNEY